MGMDYLEFASDLPLNGRISFSSAEESEEAMQEYGVDQQVRQTSKGRFLADCVLLETEETIISADRFAQACVAYYEPPPDSVSMLIFRSAGGQFLISGEGVGEDKLVVVPHGNGTDLVFPNLAGSEAIAIPKTRYTEITQVLFPSREQQEGVQIAKGDTQLLHGIRDSLIQILADAEPCDEEIANLVAQMIIWAGCSSAAERPEIIYRNQSKIDIAKQVQAYIEEHYQDEVRIEDLCRATGKEVRTMQRYFTRYFDCTITGYLKMVRLNAVHRALSSAHLDEQTVSSIAINNGFTHFGRFSVAYKQHFGESARETLRRRKN
jgi:AraC-like DNA-binding protein